MTLARRIAVASILALSLFSLTALADGVPPMCSSKYPACAACESLAAGDCCTVDGGSGTCTQEPGCNSGTLMCFQPEGLLCIVPKKGAPACTEPASGAGGGCNVEPIGLGTVASWALAGLMPLLVWKRRRRR